MKNKLWMIVLVVSLAVVVISGINVFRLSREYQKGINEYQQLESYASVKEDAPAQEETETEEQAEEESLIPVTINLQYDELKEINGDFTGWLYYEPLEISYPVVRGNDNDYYTHYTFEGEKNSSGAIFMDFLNRTDYSDYNTIVYGHNMRNGTMFGSLKKMLDDSSIQEENPNFYVFTEDAAYMYEIFAVYLTQADSRTYDLIRSEEEQQDFLDYVNETATWRSDKVVSASDKVMTLSTCHGLHSNNRTIVLGVLIARENR